MLGEYRPYTDADEAEVMSTTEGFAESGVGTDEEGTDWDRLLSDIEEATGLYLPEQWDHPLLKKVKKVYRQVWREAWADA